MKNDKLTFTTKAFDFEIYDETESKYKKVAVENGIPVDIRPYEINFANEIIEQFMLTANEVVAEKFYWLEAPFIYRVHEVNEENVDNPVYEYLNKQN